MDSRVGLSHCRDRFIADQEVFYLGRPSNRPVQEPRSEGLAKLIGGPLPGPLGHPAARAEHRGRAEALLRLLVDKRVHRHAGAWTA